MAAPNNGGQNVKLKNLKFAFKNVLEAKEFCFFCMDINNLLSIDTKNYFNQMEGTESVTVRDIVYTIMKEEPKIYSNSICTKCKAKLVDVYCFLASTRRNWCVIEDLIQQSERQIKEFETTLTISNQIALVLEDPCLEKIRLKTAAIKIKKIFQCELCNKNFASLQSLAKHVNSIHSEIKENEEIKCSECTENCVHKEYLEGCRLRKTYKTVGCVNCDYECYNKHQLILHVNRDHLDLVHSTCEICAVAFYTKKCREKHLIKYHKDCFKCVTCSGKFKSEILLEKHIRQANCESNSLKCSECSINFDSKERLENHLNRFHKGLFVCDICKMALNNRISLILHLEKHNGAITKPILKCFLCSINFTTMRQYRLHNIKTHRKDEKPICKECNKTFENHLKYNVHMKRTHFGRRYNCESCDYVGRSNSMLDAHINRYHLKITPYECEICQKRFTGDILLLNHRKTHLPNESKGFQCKECKKHFCSNSSLKKHKRLHFGKDGDPITCEICAEKFLCASQLEQHKVEKHEEKRTRCPLCESVFSSLKRVRTHVKRVHWKSKEKFDFRMLSGLEPEHYELFRDRRTPVIEN